jgi:hypothetical protein
MSSLCSGSISPALVHADSSCKREASGGGGGGGGCALPLPLAGFSLLSPPFGFGVGGVGAGDFLPVAAPVVFGRAEAGGVLLLWPAEAGGFFGLDKRSNGFCARFGLNTPGRWGLGFGGAGAAAAVAAAAVAAAAEAGWSELNRSVGRGILARIVSLIAAFSSAEIRPARASPALTAQHNTTQHHTTQHTG